MPEDVIAAKTKEWWGRIQDFVENQGKLETGGAISTATVTCWMWDDGDVGATVKVPIWEQNTTEQESALKFIMYFLMVYPGARLNAIDGFIEISYCWHFCDPD